MDMALVTGQQIANYYTHFKQIEVTFNSHVIKATGLLSKHIYLKCLGERWPCLIYSTSMSGARIIANINEAFFETTKRANNIVQLRFSFKIPEKTSPITFFIAAKIAGFTPYKNDRQDLNFINLAYTQKPPDALIETLGLLIEANQNAQHRKEERIVLTTASTRKIGLKSKETWVYIQEVPRKCLLRDLSFSGAKVIVTGIAKFLLNKDIKLRLAFDNTAGYTDIPGIIVRCEAVQGRKDITALAIRFKESEIPIDYKMRINQYIKQHHER